MGFCSRRETPPPAALCARRDGESASILFPGETNTFKSVRCSTTRSRCRRQLSAPFSSRRFNKFFFTLSRCSMKIHFMQMLLSLHARLLHTKTCWILICNLVMRICWGGILFIPDRTATWFPMQIRGDYCVYEMDWGVSTSWHDFMHEERKKASFDRAEIAVCNWCFQREAYKCALDVGIMIISRRFFNSVMLFTGVEWKRPIFLFYGCHYILLSIKVN